MARKTEYYVVVKKEGEKEGREVGAIHNQKIVRVPPEFVGRGLAMLMPEKITHAMAVALQDRDDVESAIVERIPPNSPPPPKEVDLK